MNWENPFLLKLFKSLLSSPALNYTGPPENKQRANGPKSGFPGEKYLQIAFQVKQFRDLRNI